jgi:hypothetical protein
VCFLFLHTPCLASLGPHAEVSKRLSEKGPHLAVADNKTSECIFVC